MNKIYETERLIIRKWKLTDANDLFEYASNPKNLEFLSFSPYKTKEDAINRINHLLENNKKDYAIHLKSENKVIGSITIASLNDYSAEIGYCLNIKYQGNGYMTEALKHMFSYLKHTYSIPRIYCTHDCDNIKSGNVMKRAGMTFEGILRKAGHTNNTHSHFDIALYSILDDEII